jgi:aldehyde dehydrogenase (NAD+)
MNYKGNIDYRKETLVKLLDNLIHEDEIVDALYKDFKTTI